MSAVKAVSTQEEAQLLLDTAKRKADELKGLLTQITGYVASGVYNPIPPRPTLEAIGLMCTGVSELSKGLGSLEVNPAG
jgi:hypothetical protein